jgi:hypothetical protein
MSFVGLTFSARRSASSVFSGMWILLPGCGTPSVSRVFSVSKRRRVNLPMRDGLHVLERLPFELPSIRNIAATVFFLVSSSDLTKNVHVTQKRCRIGVNVAPCSNSASLFQCFCAIIQSQAARRLTDTNSHGTITDANGIE